MNAVPERGGDKAAICPFRANVPEAELTELLRRVDTTRWPERETVSDKSQRVPLATIQKLAQYWAAEYGWRKVESEINALPAGGQSAIDFLDHAAEVFGFTVG